jgi:hypothetical protein
MPLYCQPVSPTSSAQHRAPSAICIIFAVALLLLLLLLLPEQRQNNASATVKVDL